MKASLIDAYFFDLDGTLIHSGKAFELVLMDLGWINVPFDNHAHYLSGVSTKQLLDYVLSDEQKQPHAHSIFLNQYQEQIQKYVIPYQSVESCLQYLKKLHKKIAIISNKKHEMCLEIAKSFSVPFDFVLGSGVLSTKKPDPAPLLYACDYLGVPPHKVVYIGDMPSDLEASERAKIQGIYAAYGLYSYKDPSFTHLHSINCLSSLMTP